MYAILGLIAGLGTCPVKHETQWAKLENRIELRTHATKCRNAYPAPGKLLGRGRKFMSKKLYHKSRDRLGGPQCSSPILNNQKQSWNQDMIQGDAGSLSLVL